MFQQLIRTYSQAIGDSFLEADVTNWTIPVLKTNEYKGL